MALLPQPPVATADATIIADVADFRSAARHRMQHFLFEYSDGGSHAEAALTRNVADLAGVALDQRVLREGLAVDPAISLFGQSPELSLNQPGKRKGRCRTPIALLLRISWVSPRIVEAADSGTQPKAVTRKSSISAPIPLDWE